MRPADPTRLQARVIVAGGGAAGFFGAIACAEAEPGCEVILLERSSHLLAKVRISGGGRCNVTTSTADPRALASHYPRGGRALIGPFTRFGPRETIDWFERRGVRLKTESDGRIFPVSDSSGTTIQCLLNAAREARIRIRTQTEVTSIGPAGDGRLRIVVADGEPLVCDRVLLAAGGCRSGAATGLLGSVGHTVEPPVPSLFAFQIDAPWLAGLAGLSVDPVEVGVPGAGLSARGPVLITHAGLSGPAILRLSAWGARMLHERSYRFTAEVNWFPGVTTDALDHGLRALAKRHGARQVRGTTMPPLPSRLWEQLTLLAGINPDTRWSGLARPERCRLLHHLRGTAFSVTGRTLNKDEFVTCGGARLAEIDLRTMESRRLQGLHLAGEVLDIDGLTGGYNFQAAWTTGWIAGNAMASALDGAVA